ncbi:16S rRNA (cytosine(1402)-N(4))-methyltransferase RsmH [soil metagenome]
MRHESVMVQEMMEALDLKSGDTVVDGTLGLGGHSQHFAKAITPGGTILGIDWDDAMLAEAQRRLSDIEGVRFLFVRDDFRNIGTIIKDHELVPNAIALDLGLNFAQIEDPTRGITFTVDGPLDMRLDRSKGETASSLLNRLSLTEIENILHEYGDERWARMIAKRIVERRKDSPLRTTQDLVDCVLAAIPPGARDKRIHPATRTFQAVRIAVTGELDSVEIGVRGAAEALTVNGTLAVLSYHSGEDRIVKQAFRELTAAGHHKELTKKPVPASADEAARNPKSRSAKMRAIRRISN